MVSGLTIPDLGITKVGDWASIHQAGDLATADTAHADAELEKVNILESEIETLRVKIENYNESFDAINLHYRRLSKLKDRMYSTGMVIIGILYILSITVF